MKTTKLKSFDFASDLTKQLLSLSTILIGISITFFEKFNCSNLYWIIILSWSFLFISIIFGILSLMGLTGSLGRIKDLKAFDSTNIYNRNIRVVSGLQIVTFLTGILLLIIYSSSSTKTIGNKNENNAISVEKNEAITSDTAKNNTLKIIHDLNQYILLL